MQYPSVIARLTCVPYSPDRERCPTRSTDSDARAQVETAVPLSPRPAVERKSDMHLERQWELYRLSVVEKMPDSEYRTAVLAGISHAFMRLDSIEASRQFLNEAPARNRTDRSRGLMGSSPRNGWNGGS